jgi:tetratricopeptide (TPR) repeat protein
MKHISRQPSDSTDLEPDVQELKQELAVANKTIDNLIEEVLASEERVNALNERAWRWVFRYRRLNRDFHRALGRFSNRDVASPDGNSTAFKTAPVRDDAFKNVIRLAKAEFHRGRYESAAAIAQLITQRFPDDPQAKRLLSLVESRERRTEPEHRRADYHLAIGKAHHILGDTDAALSSYQAALDLNNDLTEAQSGLAEIRMPGMNYLDWLEKLYRFHEPRTVIEIGVSQSASLARVPPPAIAIGVDPTPSVIYPLRTEAHIFPETSDQFFEQRKPDTLLAGQPLSIGFIDGLHVFEQALRDFINLESYCNSKSLIMFHDTVPLDELTQRRIPETHFSTGDVWKTILCLKHYRPDLDIFTIATPPTGLTLVIGLDPSSRVLKQNYDEAVARFIDMPFAAVEKTLNSELNMVPNNWDAVSTRLATIGKEVNPRDAEITQS